MAVPDPYKAAKTAISENQYNYLTNMAGGKTSSGGAANAGQQAWAKSQLAQSSYTPVPAPKATSQPTTPTTPAVTAPKTTVPAPPASTQSTITTPAYTDWQSKTAEQYANLEKLLQTPFSYDPNTDAGYLAQRELAQLRAGDATKNAMEAANEKGIFGSSLMTSQLGQIQQRAEQEAAAYIPEYRQQAYGRYQDQLAQAANMLQTARGLRSDQFNEGITTGQLTGNYLPAEAQPLIDSILQAKATWRDATDQATRDKAAAAANDARAQLQAMGVDPSSLGADKTIAQSTASRGGLGIRTLDGQQLDQSRLDSDRNYERSVLESDRNYNRGVLESDRAFDRGNLESDRAFEYTQGRDKVADARWEQEFARIKEQDGIQNALAWAQNSISQQNANTSSYSAANSSNNAMFGQLMDIWKATGRAPAGLESMGVQAGSPYIPGIESTIAATPTAADMRTYFDSMVQRDNSNKITNGSDLESAILNSDLSDYETYQLYLRYGLKWGGTPPTKPGNQ